MASVTFRNVWKLYGNTPVVSDLSLEVADGEFLVLVGPSGCGKTTTLRMLAGLELPTYGSICIGDDDVTTLAPGRRDVAMVFQSYALYPHMTVYKNLAFGPSVRRESKREIAAQIQQVAEMLGIEQLLARRPSELSGGQRQRVALGRVMLRHPRVSLLDEPLSNLDAALRVQMRAELVKLQRRLGVTTVYVTHDQIEAMTMGDRIAVLYEGRLIQVDTPQRLYRYPTNLTVATFIGSPKMNVVPGRAIPIADGAAVEVLGTTAPLPPRRAASLNGLPRNVLVGMRPHDLHWSKEAPNRCTETFTGTIELVEPTGAETFAVLRAGDHALMATLPAAMTAHPDMQITLAFDSGDMHVFDPETGDALLASDDGVEPKLPTEAIETRSLTK